MFKTLDEARSAISEWLEVECERGEDDISGVLEKILDTLVPTIGFEPSKENQLGVTRFGGKPDLPVGTEWPVRAVPDNFEEWIGYGGSTHEPHIRRYLERPFPFTFVAQIDLADIASLQATNNSLPTNGRLLFYYDAPTGPWQDGTAPCHVVYDDTPVSELENADEPTAFAEMIELERAEILAGEKSPYFTVEEMLEFVPKFIHPARAMKPRKKLQLLPPFSHEFEEDTAFKTLIHAENGGLYSLYDCGYSDLDWESRNDHLKHQMFGVPLAQQDDPRYTARSLSPDGKPPNAEDLTRDFASNIPASDWVLLLQVHLSDLEQDDLTEGTVYFLIYKDDLEAKRFNRTVSIYQQT